MEARCSQSAALRLGSRSDAPRSRSSPRKSCRCSRYQKAARRTSRCGQPLSTLRLVRRCRERSLAFAGWAHPRGQIPLRPRERVFAVWPFAPAWQKAKLQKLSPADVKESDLAGEPILRKLTTAPGNGEPIGGLKVVARSGWFAARPSGTENIYKIYAESFQSEAHLNAIVSEAHQIVNNALA